MKLFDVTMQHNEKTLLLLSRKQYDLFSGANKMFRSVVGVAGILFGMASSDTWWGFALMAFGCIYMTGTYSGANRKARSLVQAIEDNKMPFPAAKYGFYQDYLEITILPEMEDEAPEQVPYGELLCVGEDRNYFYLFRNQYGGYMIPKEQLNGQVKAFRQHIESSMGQAVRGNRSPFMQMVRQIKVQKKQ